MSSILSFSFFITKMMRTDLRAGQVSGTLPVSTAKAAREAGARVLSHADNRGKGAALRTGMAAAAAPGSTWRSPSTPTGSTPPDEARRLARRRAPTPRALVLGIRDLRRGRRAPGQPDLQPHLQLLPLALLAPRARATRSAASAATRSRARSRSAAGTTATPSRPRIILRAVAAGVRLVEVPCASSIPPSASASPTSTACAIRRGSSSAS